jgi:peptidoglycan hydrolase-like protein with peptidoglycan-binding domain
MLDVIVVASRWQVTRPVVFVPLLAFLALLAAYGMMEAGLALMDRWERDSAQKLEAYRERVPETMVMRYEERLRAVRAALSERGYQAGPLDGMMNERTAEALRSFQRRHGLHVSGRPDPATVAALGLVR